MTYRRNARIVFMGTPDFAVPSLRALVESGYGVCAAVTQPDRPRGRGHRLKPSPVKAAAQDYGIPVIQMNRISSPEGVTAVSDFSPDYLVTAAFGQILSQSVLDIPSRGTINVHASLLPAYRGASPVVHAIMNGENKAGVTTVFTVRQVDAGPILLQRSLEIGETETGGELTARLAELGAELLIQTLDGLADGSVRPIEQDASQATSAPTMPHGFGLIDWSRTARDIVNFVRALNPLPGAYFLLNDEKIGVLRASVGPSTDAPPGTIVAAEPKTGLLIAAADSLVSLDTIRRSGSRAMAASDSLRGRHIEAGQLVHSSTGAVE